MSKKKSAWSIAPPRRSAAMAQREHCLVGLALRALFTERGEDAELTALEVNIAAQPFIEAAGYKQQVHAHQSGSIRLSTPRVREILTLFIRHEFLVRGARGFVKIGPKASQEF